MKQAGRRGRGRSPSPTARPSSTRCSSTTPAARRRTSSAGVNNGWKVANDHARLRARACRPPPATAASRRSSTASSTRPRANGTHRRSGRPPAASPRHWSKIQIMRINGLRTLTRRVHDTQGPGRGRARRHQQDVLVRDAPRHDGAGDRHPRPDGQMLTGTRRTRRSWPASASAARPRGLPGQPDAVGVLLLAGRRRSGAAPPRSSATSWASGCSACPANRRPSRRSGSATPPDTALARTRTTRRENYVD